MSDTIVNFLKSNVVALISASIALSSAVISLTALSFSIHSWRKTRTSTLYSDIDGRYMELLKLGITNPEFVDPVYTSDYKRKYQDDKFKLLKYERYAFASWNIVETIIDRHGDKHLEKTWYPVIKEENRLHRWWLNNRENEDKFKNEFWDFIVGNEAFPCPDCNGKSLCPRCTELRKHVKQEKRDESKWKWLSQRRRSA